QLQLQSKDAIPSFWVPEFGQKQDAVPGLLTKLVITPNKLGTFPVVCTELCGLGHAFMRSRVPGRGAPAYEGWLRQKKAGGPGLSGKALFTANCGGCHALAAVGASGTFGP